MVLNSSYTQAGEDFRSLFHSYNACMQRMLSKYGLYPGQPQMLFAIRELKNPTQNELALQLRVSKASAGVSLRRLESAGFVKRVRDQKDLLARCRSAACFSRLMLKPCTRGLAAITPISGGKTTS